MIRRARSPFAHVLVLFVPLLLVLSACTPAITLAELDRRVHATSLPSFDRWWRGEQAAAHGVRRAIVDRWVATSSGRLDADVARRRPWDVSTDLCSFAPDAGPAFDFRVPCIRHDFAWRNLRRLQTRLGGHLESRSTRLAASEQFLRDMQATCAWRPAVQRPGCRALAQAYFRAVSVVS